MGKFNFILTHIYLYNVTYSKKYILYFLHSNLNLIGMNFILVCPNLIIKIEIFLMLYALQYTVYLLNTHDIYSTYLFYLMIFQQYYVLLYTHDISSNITS